MILSSLTDTVAVKRLRKNPGLTEALGVLVLSFPTSFRQVAIFILHLSYLARGHVCLQGKD